jgi:hypothetical protein
MKFETLRLLTACLALTATACGTETESSTNDLGDALDSLASAAEEEALREHGVDAEDAEAAEAEEAAGEELGDEAEEAPGRGERIQAFCAERSAEVLARCEAAAAAGELPEGAPACEDIAARAEQQCVRRAVRHVRHRIQEHVQGCREEARAPPAPVSRTGASAVSVARPPSRPAAPASRPCPIGLAPRVTGPRSGERPERSRGSTAPRG